MLFLELFIGRTINTIHLQFNVAQIAPTIGKMVPENSGFSEIVLLSTLVFNFQRIETDKLEEPRN